MAIDGTPSSLRPQLQSDQSMQLVSPAAVEGRLRPGLKKRLVIKAGLGLGMAMAMPLAKPGSASII